MTKRPELVVVGGGLAGLLLAAHAGERFGGLLNTVSYTHSEPTRPY